jgi:hypothetical protein
MKNNILLVISVCVILYIILLLTNSKPQNNNILNEKINIINHNHRNTKSIKLYYCGKNKLNYPIKNAILHYNLKITTDIQETQLYMPCGFNYIEVELNKIRFANTNSKYNLSNKVILGISKCDLLCSKNELWSRINKQYGTEMTYTILPKSYIINNPNDLIMLKDKEETDAMYNYNNKGIYILKNNRQGKKGLHLTNNIKAILNNKSKLLQYKVIQEYITKPFLINKRKVNIRLYVLIINEFNKDPKWYIYYEGKCIYTNKDYTAESIDSINLEDKEQHFTSYNLDYNYVYNILKNPESLEDLQLYLGLNNYNTLINNIKGKLRYIKNAYNSQNDLKNNGNLKNNICMQYFGIDVILDSNLEPYILEFNKGPELTCKSPKDEQLKHTFMLSIFDIALNKYNMINNNMVNNNMVNSNLYNKYITYNPSNTLQDKFYII